MNNKRMMFAAGIEDTFIVDPHKQSGKTLEEYELIGHYDKWRTDLQLVASLAVDALRWGIPWYRVERVRGEFDWSWTDQVIRYLVDELHIAPIVDLIHYGTPPWLKDGILDPEFPSAFMHYVEQFISHYDGIVEFVTPVNEPLTAAEFCGRRAEWPPYMADDTSFIGIMVVLSRVAILTSEKLADAGMKSVHVEVAGRTVAGDPSLQEAAVQKNLQNQLYWDLITGKVDDLHGLTPWLMSHGCTKQNLSWFRDHPAHIDIFGVNYYPQWSDTVLLRTANGQVISRPVNSGSLHFSDLMENFWNRYQLPLMVTETSIRGPVWEKTHWLRESVAACAALRARKIPVVGYTWFPVIDMVDWEYRNQSGPIEDFVIELGLWTIDRSDRSCVEAYREIIRNDR